MVFRKGYLLQVILPVVRVVGERVIQFFHSSGHGRVACLCHSSLIVAIVISSLGIILGNQVLLVAYSPEILVCPVAPFLAEVRHSPFYGGGIVEVPWSGLACTCACRHGIACLRIGPACVGGIASRPVACVGLCILPVELLLLLLFLLLQFFYHPVYCRQVLRLRHLGKHLQAVLQLDGTQMRLKFCQYLAPPFALLVLLVLLVQYGNALLVGTCSLDILLPFPVKLAQPKQQYGLVGSGLRCLLDSLLPRIYAMERVARIEVYVPHGIVHLVQIVLVLVAACHPLEP